MYGAPSESAATPPTSTGTGPPASIARARSGHASGSTGCTADLSLESDGQSGVEATATAGDQRPGRRRAPGPRPPVRSSRTRDGLEGVVRVQQRHAVLVGVRVARLERVLHVTLDRMDAGAVRHGSAPAWRASRSRARTRRHADRLGEPPRRRRRRGCRRTPRRPRSTCAGSESTEFERAARLERAGVLGELELEHDPGVDTLVAQVDLEDGSTPDGGTDPGTPPPRCRRASGRPRGSTPPVRLSTKAATAPAAAPTRALPRSNRPDDYRLGLGDAGSARSPGPGPPTTTAASDATDARASASWDMRDVIAQDAP